MGKHKPNKTKKEKAEREARKKQQQAREAGEIDEETAQQVKEIEDRLQDITFEMKRLERKQATCTLEANRATLTQKQVEIIPNDAKCYRQIGKAFMLAPKDRLCAGLQTQAALKAVESKQVKQSYAKLEERCKSELEGLKELIGQEKLREMLNKQYNSSSNSASSMASKGNLPDADAGVVPIYGKVATAASADENAADSKEQAEEQDTSAAAAEEVAGTEAEPTPAESAA
mmetsp:Transcript_103442/g.179537  ORF Transcript_103442/g.179537 Transcript_103442/m.179537 type:complete len:230 (+) Transcript_103442:120-809(+)